MINRCILFASLVLCPLTAAAQTQVLLINQTLVDNEFIFGITSQTKTQRVLTAANPALLGVSREYSKILLSPSLTGRAVTNENYGTSTGRWRVAISTLIAKKRPA